MARTAYSTQWNRLHEAGQNLRGAAGRKAARACMTRYDSAGRSGIRMTEAVEELLAGRAVAVLLVLDNEVISARTVGA